MNDSLTADPTLFPLAGAADKESAGAYAGSKRSIKIIARQVNFFYGKQQALVDNNIAAHRAPGAVGGAGPARLRAGRQLLPRRAGRQPRGRSPPDRRGRAADGRGPTPQLAGCFASASRREGVTAGLTGP